MRNLILSARWLGIILFALVGATFGQIPDTLHISGKVTGDVLPGYINITVKATPPSRGGGTKSFQANKYFFDNLSYFFAGTATASGFGWKTTPELYTFKTLMHGVDTINFVVKDTMKPELKIVNLKDTNVMVGQPIILNMTCADNTGKARSFYYDYSDDSGKTWSKIGGEISQDFIWIGIIIKNLTRMDPHSFTFTMQKPGKITLRVKLVDYFGLETTQTVAFTVQATTNIKPLQIKIKKEKFESMTFDLRGRSLSYSKNKMSLVTINRGKFTSILGEK